MAWNEPGGNGNDKDPWGNGGNRGNNNQGPPDLDEAFRKLNEKIGSLFGGKGGGQGGRSSGSAAGGIFPIAFVLLAVLYFWSAAFTVDEKEQVVVLRFGEYKETVGPGLHFYFPPIDSKFQENVTELRTYNVRQKMLTEDENIVEVSLSVQYNVSNLKNYVLEIADPISTLEQATQSALRHVVGTSKMHSVLTEGRSIISAEVAERLQAYVNDYKSGLYISKINVESTQPPREVQAAFDDVIRAREDRERVQNKAIAYRNAILPQAKGKSKRITEEAQAYKAEITAKANGETSRFKQVLVEYKKAPEITRSRMYIETIQDVLGETNKVIVDVEGGNNLMYLPLDKLMGANPTAPTSLTGQPVLTQQEMDAIADKVAGQLRKRTSSNRTGGRVAR
ncbi:FtsH protease activity modulator HflK [Endozoicomonas sp. SM1973]|uniref:Protein HflK n=1 Tax=Spartinivicinus marinus TaxID=2994442 RepID=A0A853I7S0_9GAMM|nr:FtsH protease activity modulator HflK [Spartinivicinus marinus]MCX4027604.1 FtsH protease activity modulator HflK [Spartinivicinus marinus]NYZ66698.1 FtsH protease activity modulator HflK [Spartinivicinus marinus]